MNRSTLVGGMTLLLLLGLAPGVAPAGTKGLIGAWRVVSVQTHGSGGPVPASLKMILTFKSGGKMSLSVRYRGRHVVHRGTYKVKGNRLTMTLDGNTENVTYVQKGSDLTLVNARKSETSQLKRM